MASMPEKHGVSELAGGKGESCPPTDDCKVASYVAKPTLDERYVATGTWLCMGVKRDDLFRV